MTWLINILKNVGPAAIGYFINDFATWVNGFLPADIQTKTKGGRAVWFIIALMVVLAVVLFFIIKTLMPRGKKGRMFLLAAGAVTLDYLLPGITVDGAPVQMATVLVTLTTGAAVVTSVNLNFLPERIAYAAATQLSGVKISVQGDGVVFDSDANGLTHAGLNRVLGQVTNNYVLTLGDSLIPKKNVLFEFTNSAAQTPVVYYDSDSSPKEGIPPMFYQMAKVPLFVGGNDFTDFSILSLPSLAATDSLTITYTDGTVQANLTRADLQYKLGYTQNVVNTPIYQIDNLEGRIKSVSVVCVAAQTGYLQLWTPSLKNLGIPSQAR